MCKLLESLYGKALTYFIKQFSLSFLNFLFLVVNWHENVSRFYYVFYFSISQLQVNSFLYIKHFLKYILSCLLHFLEKIERIIIYYTMVYYTSFHSGDKTGTNIIRYIYRKMGTRAIQMVAIHHHVSWAGNDKEIESFL